MLPNRKDAVTRHARHPHWDLTNQAKIYEGNLSISNEKVDLFYIWAFCVRIECFDPLFACSLLQLLRLHCCIAFAAVYGAIVGRLERNLCFLAALCADRREEFLLGSGCVLSCISAGFASLRLVLEASFCVEFLLACREGELSAAFLANQCFVLIHVFYLALKNGCMYFPQRRNHTVISARRQNARYSVIELYGCISVLCCVYSPSNARRSLTRMR